MLNFEYLNESNIYLLKFTINIVTLLQFLHFDSFKLFYLEFNPFIPRTY